MTSEAFFGAIESNLRQLVQERAPLPTCNLPNRKVRALKLFCGSSRIRELREVRANPPPPRGIRVWDLVGRRLVGRRPLRFRVFVCRLESATDEGGRALKAALRQWYELSGLGGGHDRPYAGALVIGFGERMAEGVGPTGADLPAGVPCELWTGAGTAGPEVRTFGEGIGRIVARALTPEPFAACKARVKEAVDREIALNRGHVTAEAIAERTGVDEIVVSHIFRECMADGDYDLRRLPRRTDGGRHRTRAQRLYIEPGEPNWIRRCAARKMGKWYVQDGFLPACALTITGAFFWLFVKTLAAAGAREKPIEPEIEETFKIGSRVFDRYVIRKELGIGGMGRVFLADNKDSQIASHQQVVLKVLRDNLCQDESSRQQFIREADILSSMRDDRIAACYECQFHGSTPVLVMEYVEGESLDKYLTRRGGKVDERETRELLRPIAEALDYAHGKRTYHLDVKPQNIIVRKEPKAGSRTCLLDFGISRQTHADGSMTMTMSTSGTVQYMAPDQRMGEVPSVAMDVYSLAATAYECIMGKVPYPYGWKMTGTVDPIASGTPFAAAIMRGIEGIPSKRPATCMGLIDPPEDEGASIKGEKGRARVNGEEDGNGPVPEENLGELEPVFRNYRILLQNSATKLMRGDAERAAWLKERQAQLRELTTDLAHADARALERFFNDVQRHMAEAKSTPDVFFADFCRLTVLRDGLPKTGGRVWQAIKKSVAPRGT